MGMRTNRLTLILALEVLAFGAGPMRLQALNPSKAITQYLQTSWSTESGLPQSTVKAVVQTTDGYIWLGTEEGLARFDGVRFVNYTHRTDPGFPSDFIQALASARDGSLWIGTDTGLTHLLPGGDEPGRTASVRMNGRLGTTNINALCEGPDGSVWVGTSEGLSRISGSAVES